jgi:hypothetical protein
MELLDVLSSRNIGALRRIYLSKYRTLANGIVLVQKRRLVSFWSKDLEKKERKK